MKVAIAGFEKTGKTTLFNAIVGLNIETSPGQTPETLVHEGVATVLDPRITALKQVFNPKKTTYATVEYLDLPGLAKSDATRNQKILDFLKEQDLIVHVIRAFDDTTTVHPFDTVDVGRDVRNFESELALTDLVFIEKRIEKIESNIKRGLKENPAELEVLKALKTHMDAEQPLRTFSFTAEQRRLLQPYKFISSRPVIHVVNHGEKLDAGLSAKIAELSKNFSIEKQSAGAHLCAKVEKEISELAPGDREGFLQELNIEEPAANLLVRESYRLLGLIAFFTVGEDEVRAWTIKDGMSAKEAGGRIHSDIEKGFIRAEVVSYEEFMKHKDFKPIKEKGLLRLEGKMYIVRDGDVMSFRFNV